MDLKNLLGFGFTIIGLSLAPLLFLFILNSQEFNILFLLSLGLCAVIFLFLGIFILNRS